MRSADKVLVFMTAMAAPFAFLLETGMRYAFFPSEFQELREFLAPTLAWVAWPLAVLSIGGAWMGMRLLIRQGAKAIAKIPVEHRTAERVSRAQVGAFLLTSSFAQLPAIAATLSFMFGAPLVPVLVAIIASTLGVSVQGGATLSGRLNRI